MNQELKKKVEKFRAEMELFAEDFKKALEYDKNNKK